MNLTVLSPYFRLLINRKYGDKTVKLCVFVDLNLFRHCSIEVNGDKEKPQVDFVANANDQCTGQSLQ